MWAKRYNDKENLNKTQRASIIYKDNKYYYIYGEEGQIFLGFEIFRLYANNWHILNINHTIHEVVNKILLFFHFF